MWCFHAGSGANQTFYYLNLVHEGFFSEELQLIQRFLTFALTYWNGLHSQTTGDSTGKGSTVRKSFLAVLICC
jgi:hypothetical protein